MHFEGFGFEYKGTEVIFGNKNVNFFVYGINSPVPYQNFHAFGELELCTRFKDEAVKSVLISMTEGLW